MPWDWAPDGLVGQREPRRREARLWLPPPSMGRFLGAPLRCHLRENSVGSITDHVLYAHLIHREGRGWCVVERQGALLVEEI